MKLHLAINTSATSSKEVPCQVKKSVYSRDHGYTKMKSVATAQELKDFSVKMPSEVCSKCLKLALEILNN